MFYKDLLRIDLSEFVTHELVGKEYLQQWYDATLRPRAVYGKVVACRKQYGGDYLFTVEYEEHSRALVNSSAAAFQNEVPAVSFESECKVWEGCILADQRGLLPPRGLGNKLKDQLRWRWIMPESMYDDKVMVEGHGLLPRRGLIVLSHLIMLQVKPSSIPGAGLGVWVSCQPLSPLYAKNKFFTLKAGDMIDLGIYAPLRRGDRKPDHISVLKNFIHEWECESYSFGAAQFRETARQSEDVLDITCDFTDDLHEDARNCIMPFVNETDGVEPPTIHAEHDPSGAVHHTLGNSEESLRLPMYPKEIEVKVDYGSSYEKIRVRKGYSRSSKSDQKEYLQAIEHDDHDMAVDVGHYSAREVLVSINFFEDLLAASPVHSQPRSVNVYSYCSCFFALEF